MFLVDVVEVLENMESHFSGFVLCVFHCFPGGGTMVIFP